MKGRSVNEGESSMRKGAQAKKLKLKKRKIQKVLKPDSPNDANVSRKQLKCNLAGFHRLVTAAKNLGCLNFEHLSLISQTPFDSLFWAFYEDKLSSAQYRRYEADLWKLIKCYNVEADIFEFGSAKLKLTSNDVKKVFNLKQGIANHVVIHETNEEREKEFVQKYFCGKKGYYAPDIFSAFLNAIQIDDSVVAEDVVCLMIMYLCATVFFPMTNSKLSKSTFRKCLNLDAVNQVDWAEDILEFLKKQLKQKGQHINGCVMSIMYWFCDVSHIIRPIKGTTADDASFLKWNVGEFHVMLESKSFKDILISEITSEDVTVENKMLKEEILRLKEEVEKLSKSLEEGRVEISELKEENEKLRSTNKDDIEAAAHVEENDPVKEDANLEVDSPVDDEAQQDPVVEEAHVEDHRSVEEDNPDDEEAIVEERVKFTAEEQQSVEEDAPVDAGVEDPRPVEDTHVVQGQQTEDIDEEDAPSVPSRILRLKCRDDRKKVHYSTDYEMAIVPYGEDVTYKREFTIADPLNFAPPKDGQEKKDVQRKGKRKIIDVDDESVQKKKVSSVEIGAMKRTKVGKILNDAEIDQLTNFIEGTTSGDWLWGYDDDSVGIDEVKQLLRSECISSNIINSYLVIISKEEEHKQSMFMSTIAWECVYRDEHDGIMEQLFIPLLANWGDVQKVFIPMNIDAKHFVLLVVDKKKATTTLYDSLGANTSSKCKSYSAASKMNFMVQSALDKMRMYGVDWVKDKQMNYTTSKGKEKSLKITDSMNVSIGDSNTTLNLMIAQCPTQPGRSLDCGIAVAHFAENLSKDIKVPDYLPPDTFNTDMLQMRRTMLRVFMNDEYSWSLGNARTDARVDPTLAELTTQIQKCKKKGR